MQTRHGGLNPEIVMIGLAACGSMVFGHTEYRGKEEYLISELEGLMVLIAQCIIYKFLCPVQILWRHCLKSVLITGAKVIRERFTHKVSKLPELVLVAAFKEIDLLSFSGKIRIIRIQRAPASSGDSG